MGLQSEPPIYIMCKMEAAACDEDNGKSIDGITVRDEYPRYPPLEVSGADFKSIREIVYQRYVSIAKSIANDIIVRDPTPKWVSEIFYEKSTQLVSILEKDSVRSFILLFKKDAGRGFSRNLTITSQTLTYIVGYDALRCAKVVLEGKAPGLDGRHANPNCINMCGYFPLHEAAERFCVDMIKLLLRHGASANVRTVGNKVIEGLLPLHVAVENTCLHKYLEDNLYPDENHLYHIYKLIHLLCLPDMKIFLDTIRVLAAKTNNLIDELWNYMKDGKLIQSAVVLLAAQDQIRGGCSSKMNDGSKEGGFGIIMNRILKLSLALRWEKGSNRISRKLMEEKRAHLDCTALLVDVISHNGEALSACIQANYEVPHREVMEHVSSILKEYGFCAAREVIDTINLRPYDCKMYDKASSNKDATAAVTEMVNQHAAVEKAVKNKLPRGWDPSYTKRSFFPYWRSMLLARCPKVIPAYASAWERPLPDLKQLRVSSSNSLENGSTPLQNRNVGSLRRTPQLKGNNQSGRLFGTATAGAFRVLKVLKKA